MYNIVVFASGKGTNLQRIIEEVDKLAVIKLLVVNKIERIGAVEKAERAGIPWKRVYWRKKAGVSREDYDRKLAEIVVEAGVEGGDGVDLVVLAGWMHILTGEGFLNVMAEKGIRVINLHPALAGSFKGANAIEDAWRAHTRVGLEKTGVMCHYVIPEVDAGEMICQREVPILERDTFETLRDRIRKVEKEVLIEGIRIALSGKPVVKKTKSVEEKQDCSLVGGRLIYSGKVRDVWDLGDGCHLGIVATDRLSSFDRYVCEVQGRGVLLTQIAKRMFQLTCGLCPNHLVCCDEGSGYMKVLKCRALKVEVVVRGYLTGSTSTSILTHYQRGERKYCGWVLPDGLRAHEKLPEIIVTPTTKAGAGDGGDQLVDIDQVVESGLVDSQEQWDQICRIAIEMYKCVSQWIEGKGFILADTKLEFGVWEGRGERGRGGGEGGGGGGQLMLIDEAFTPDSSRYWRKSSYVERLECGGVPESLDKDIIRQWLRENCVDPCDLETPLPTVPDELKNRVLSAYEEFYSAII